MAVTFDANKDYKQAMNDYVKAGGKATDATYKSLETQREAKIASNPATYGQYSTQVPTKDILDGTMKVSDPVASVIAAKEQYAKLQAAGDYTAANDYSKYADAIRNTSGLDPNKYGANVTLDQARVNATQPQAKTITPELVTGIPKIQTTDEKARPVTEVPVETPKTAAFNSFVPQSATPRGAADLAAMYGGITYDEGAIKAKFDAATKGEYDMLGKQYDMTENKFYDKLYGMQGTALDTIRKSNAASVATGASRGMQAANELSAILGLEQQGTAEATTLAQERNLLKDKEAAAYTKNVVDALSSSNQAKLALAGLSNNQYATDTQFNVGEMDYYARLDTAVKNLEGMIAQANATKYTADQNLTGNKYTADKNLGGVQYTADKNVQGVQYNADKNVEGVKYSSDKNVEGVKYSSDKNYSGTVYNADKNYSGTLVSAQAQKDAAAISASGQRDAASISAAATKAAAAISAAGYASSGKAATPDIADALAKYVVTGDYKTYAAVMSQSGVKPESIKETWDNARAAYQGTVNGPIKPAENDKPVEHFKTMTPAEEKKKIEDAANILKWFVN